MKKAFIYIIIPLFLEIIVFLIKYNNLGGLHVIFYFGLICVFILGLISFLKTKKRKFLSLFLGLSACMIYVFIIGTSFRLMNWSYGIFSIFNNHLYPGYIEVNYDSFKWETSQPNLSEINQKKLDSIIACFSKEWYTRSLLIIKDDTLITEEYFNNANSNYAFNIRSVTKSITSALIGLAIENNFIKSTSDNFIDYFPEYKNDIEKEKLSITIQNLLTMSGGWRDNTEMHWKGYNWIKSTIYSPLDYKAGNKFDYCNSQPVILSEIISRQTGKTTADFMTEYLFNFLGIKYEYWQKSPRGLHNGAGNMYLTARDMARFGNLFLNKGNIDGKQLIPEEWISKSLINYKNSDSEIGTDGYGYLWWLDEIDSYFTYHAGGLGGQFILNIPDLKLTIITTAESNVNKNDSRNNMAQIYNYMTEIIKLFHENMLQVPNNVYK